MVRNPWCASLTPRLTLGPLFSISHKFSFDAKRGMYKLNASICITACESRKDDAIGMMNGKIYLAYRGHITARQSQKDSFLKQLTDAAEDKLLVLVVGLPRSVIKSESNVRAGPKLESDHGKEEDFQAVDLLSLLLKSEFNIPLERKLEPEDKKEEREDLKAAELLSLLVESKSTDLSDASIEFNLRSAALRSDCQKTSKCMNQCEQKSCQNTCKAVYDAYNQCDTTTTTRKPCGGQKWGKTLPPHWRSLLRAWKSGPDEYLDC